MAVVKGSEQQYLVIRAHNPWKKFRFFLYILVIIILTGAGGYFFGMIDSVERIRSLSSENSNLDSQLEKTNQKVIELTQRVGMLQKGNEVDQEAAQGVRKTVKDLKAQITTLEEEVGFYKGIMLPAKKDKGLRVNKINVQPLGERRYRYSITASQVADNSTYIQGIAAVNVIGVRGGAKLVIPLRDLDSKVNTLGIKFRFRYFQEIAGEILLPSDFDARQLQVVLQSKGNKSQRVEETIDWP